MKWFVCLSACAFLFLSSCIVTHSGHVSSGPLIDRSDKYVDVAIGRANSVFVFGMGDLGNDDLVLKAKNNLYFSRPLSKDEYYSNITTSITRKLVLFVIHTTKVTVSADVLQPRDTSSERFSGRFKRLTGSEVYLEKKTAQTYKPVVRNTSILIVGDTVYFSNNQKGYQLFEVISLDQGSSLLKGLSGGAENVLVPAGGTFFIRNVEIDGIRGGSNVRFDYQDEALNKVADEGVVLGVSANYALVQTISGVSVHPISKLKKK